MSCNDHTSRVLSCVRDSGSPAAENASAIALMTPAEPTVLRSWQRCVANYGLEPQHTPPPTILTQSELKDVRAPVDDLIGTARSEIDRLFSRIAPSDYVVLLTDFAGVVVDFRCPRQQLSSARVTGLYLGAVWAEAQQGTNGVGTCVHEARSLSIVMDDHFSTRNTSLTCTVAPIFGCEGRLIGVLDVSTARPTDHASQAIMRQIVDAAAQRIENIQFGYRHARHTMVRVSHDRSFSDFATEARLALSNDGRVIEAGSNASRLLVRDGGVLRGQHVENLLRLRIDELLAASAPLAINAVDGGKLFVRVEDKREPYALRNRARLRESAKRNVRQPDYDLEALAGFDSVMLSNIDIARRMVDRELPIVLTGETGTGKGLFAHALHNCSSRSSGPFVSVNCAAIPQELIESELFGYRAGAFTGANSQGFKGRLLEADGGTIFLDEIGDMPLTLQTRLLQVLSDRQFTPIGATQPVTLDISVISATLHDLPQLVRTGRFREDLLFRLCGVTLTLPALRHRTDRALLIRGVLEEEAKLLQLRSIPAESTMTILTTYCWPGNMRELRYVARYAITLAEKEGDLILPRHLPSTFAAFESPMSELGPQTQEPTPVEARAIQIALQRTAWNITATATLLGISRATLHRKIRKFGLQRH